MSNITEKQKCIAEQAVYGDLHFVNPSGNVRKLDVVSSIMAYNDKGAIFTPILRPMSNLTKEITHKGYNDDQLFIPLVEVAKVLDPKLHWSLETNTIGSYAYARENAFPHYVRPSQLACCSIDLFDLLHLWHFDTRKLIEKGDAVDVNTLDINPYSVKL